MACLVTSWVVLAKGRRGSPGSSGIHIVRVHGHGGIDEGRRSAELSAYLLKKQKKNAWLSCLASCLVPSIQLLAMGNATLSLWVHRVPVYSPTSGTTSSASSSSQ